MRKVSLFKRMDDLNLLIGCYLLVLKYTARDLISGVQSNFSCHWELVSFFLLYQYSYFDQSTVYFLPMSYGHH